MLYCSPINQYIVGTMIICDFNVQHDMDKYYNQWRYYITIFITLFTTYRRTVFTTRGFASNITGHFLFYASIYENKIVIGLTHGNDGFASTGDVRRKQIEYVLCQYIQLIRNLYIFFNTVVESSDL